MKKSQLTHAECLIGLEKTPFYNKIMDLDNDHKQVLKPLCDILWSYHTERDLLNPLLSLTIMRSGTTRQYMPHGVI